MQKEEIHEQTWDRKKIFLAVLVVVILIGAFVYTNFFGLGKKGLIAVMGVKAVKVNESGQNISKQKGAADMPSVRDIQSGIAQKIDSIKNEVTHLNVSEIASSSPQVQKILNDIKSLEKLPGNQARQLCENVCKSL